MKWNGGLSLVLINFFGLNIVRREDRSGIPIRVPLEFLNKLLFFQEWYQISWEVFAQCLAINASKNKFKKWCQPSQENIQRNGVKCWRTILAANLGHYITFNYVYHIWYLKFWVFFEYYQYIGLICFASMANFCSIWHWIESTPIQKYLNFLIFIGLFIFCLWSGITHMIYFEFNT